MAEGLRQTHKGNILEGDSTDKHHRLIDDLIEINESDKIEGKKTFLDKESLHRKKLLKFIEKNRERFIAIIKDVKGEHNVFSAFSNDIFPFCDAEGKALTPYEQKAFAVFLSTEREYKNKVAFRNDYIIRIISYTMPIEDDDDDYKEKYPNGMSIAELSKIANLDESHIDYQKMLKRINIGMFSSLNFTASDKNQDYKYKLNKLEKVCNNAENLFLDFINNIYGEGSKSKFEPIDIVGTENNPAKLILILFKRKIASYTKDEIVKIKFEAKRKLLFAREIGLANSHKDNLSQANNKYTALMGKIGMIGIKKDMYLVSYHEGDDKKCIRAEFVDSKPEKYDKNVKIREVVTRTIKLPVRQFGEIVKKDGKVLMKEIVYFSQGRSKAVNNLIIKGIIKDSGNPHSFTEDINGQRLIFQDINDYEIWLAERQHAFRMNGVDTNFWDWEDSEDGRVNQDVLMRPGQSDKFQVIKYHENIHFPEEVDSQGNKISDAVKYVFENQFFNPMMYANYQFQVGVMHKQYSVNRVYEMNLTEMLTPEFIYNQDIKEYQLRRNMDIIKLEWSVKEAVIWGRDFVIRTVHNKIAKLKETNSFNKEEKTKLKKWVIYMNNLYKLNIKKIDIKNIFNNYTNDNILAY